MMQDAILATDLPRFFGNREKLQKIVDSGTFSWDTPEHR